MQQQDMMEIAQILYTDMDITQAYLSKLEFLN